jgi:glycosyltransferase involved in cell wall biosynthesis
MSLSCPFITSDVPGAREQYGDAALYFDPTSEQELAQRIKDLLENNSLRDLMIRTGKDRATSLTVADYAKRVVSIFDEFARIARAWEKCDSVFN